MTSKLRIAALVAGVGVSAAAFVGGQVWAGGIPASDTLHYSGTLEDASGTPLNGDRFIEVKLWHEASSDTGSPDCTTQSQKRALVSGHFSLPLPAACRDAVARHSQVFVEVIVDGATLGRAKLGAVPYAVESDHATKADSAGTAENAAGELKASLENEASRVASLELATTPAGVIERFNAATSDGAPVRLGPITWQPQNDLGWSLQHAAAAAGCAAASPPGDSGSHHVVLVKPSGVTCGDACATNGPPYVNCRTSIAIGQVTQAQATAYTDFVATNYNYGCGDSQQNYDEVLGQGLSTVYSAYCCCYL